MDRKLEAMNGVPLRPMSPKEDTEGEREVLFCHQLLLFSRKDCAPLIWIDSGQYLSLIHI